MSVLLQDILIFIAMALALYFLFTTFIWNPFKKKKANVKCGNDKCGCN